MPNKPILDITIQLSGEDGNAFAIMGRVTRTMKEHGHGDLVDKYREEAMSGDYDHLIQTTMKWVNVI